MQATYDEPNIHFLLLHDQGKMIEMEYIDDQVRIQVPLIGPRPPFYIHPIYVPYHPIL